MKQEMFRVTICPYCRKKVVAWRKIHYRLRKHIEEMHKKDGY